MKKLLALLVCVAMLFAFSGCTHPNENDIWNWSELPAAPKTGVTINVYNWGEYIDDSYLEVNRAFTHMTGIEVNYKTFDTNEAMYALISNGAADYDVIVPSDYMIGKMVKEGLLAKLNFDNIPNYKYIDELYKNLEYDPQNEYSVPYTWGVVGIFYNSKYVDEADVAQGWDLLWNEKYAGNIYMFDNQRDAFGVALSKLGYSLNTTNLDEIDKAGQLLLELKPLLQAKVMDQVYDKMINEEGWIAPYYAGDMVIMMDEEEGNPDIRFTIPGGKTNFFVDAMCIPAASQHKAEAEAYINFMCQTEVALANTLEIGYSTPHTEARKLLDPEVGENELFYPPKEVLDQTEVFLTLPEEVNERMNYWWRQLNQ